MQKDAIKDGLTRLAPWFHRVELPGGLVSKDTDNFGEGATHPLPTWEHVKTALPEDLTGKSVLDVGCNAGFYSFAAAERGAERVFGCDAVRWHVRQARFLAQARGESRVSFDRVSLYELSPEKHGTFDVVMALGLVYHLKHLVAGLEKLFSITGDRLILESAVIDAKGDLKAKSDEPLERARDHLYFLGYAKNSPFAKESALNWFFPTPDALKAMVEDVGFVDVEICDVFNRRCMITARKPSEVIDSRYPAYLRAEIEVEADVVEGAPGTSLSIPLTLRNTGRAYWRCQGDGLDKGAVGLRGSLTDESDPVFGRDVNSALPQAVAPGEALNFLFTLPLPIAPGEYLLELDLVSENVCLFQDVGSPPRRLTVRVV